MKMNKSHLAVGCGRVATAVIAAGLAASLGVLAPSVAVADEAPATTLEATTQQDSAAQAADEPEAGTDVAAAAPVTLAAEGAADDQPTAGAETPVPEAVAVIDKTGYATLDAALAAAKNGDVIDLQSDAVTEKGFGIDGKALTVNGNGHVITANKRGVYVLKGGKPASLTFNDVTLNMAPVEGTAQAAGNEANWAAVVLNYGCDLVFNNSTVTISPAPVPASSVNTGVYFHDGARLTLNNSNMSVNGFKINGFATDGASYTTEINVLADSKLEVLGNGAGITSAIQVTVDDSRLTNSKNRGNGSNGADYIVRNGSVADVSGNGSHGMSARNVTIAGSSTVTCNDNGNYGVTFYHNFDIDGTSSLMVDRNGGVGCGGLRATASAEGHVAKGAVVEICNNKHNGLENKGKFKFDEGSKLTIMGNHDPGNGGGVFNSGNLTLPSDAVIYNNHAGKSGDDICSEGSIRFGSTGADWVLDDCNHAIDGWYDDAATSRWSAHGETKHVVLAQPGEIKGAIALKAAHGLVSVDYKYVGGAPEGAKVPDADTDLELDAPYTAKAPESVDGYTFDGWYTDEACTAKWNDGDALTGSMTLYGKWTKNPAAPTTPDAGNKTPDKKLPQTGDTTSAALPALLAGGSLAALGAGIALRRREH